MSFEHTALIVNDCPFLLEAYCAQLSDKLNIFSARNGNEALEMMLNPETAKQIDIVFMDINMPGIDGFEVTEKIFQ